MNPASIPEKPLVAGVNQKNYAPEYVYWFEREDGSVFYEDAQAAWATFKGKQAILGQSPQRVKYLGRSTGQVYHQAVMESRQIFQEKGLEAAQAHLREAMQMERESATDRTPPPNYDTIDKHGRPVNMNDLR